MNMLGHTKHNVKVYNNFIDVDDCDKKIIINVYNYISTFIQKLQIPVTPVNSNLADMILHTYPNVLDVNRVVSFAKYNNCDIVVKYTYNKGDTISYIEIYKSE
uniref:Uncharacterized protein n=1 Tax=viral metagenome TaxID=1070528 RepID=A0A6C0CJN1_9ZZZZ